MMDEWYYGSDAVCNHYYPGGIFMMIFVFILLAVGIYVLLRYARTAPGTSQQPEDAMGILKKRYASGEIDKKEFEEKKKALAE